MAAQGVLGPFGGGAWDPQAGPRLASNLPSVNPSPFLEDLRLC